VGHHEIIPVDQLTIDDMEDHPPYPDKIKTVEYLSELRLLQIELLKLQRWCRDSGEKVVILFEGRDAAGKGGSIRRFMENLNPRGARTVALPKPNDTERGQWYFQRYVQHLPTAGEIVLFDRSWYNRAGVEIVMGFCTPQEYGEFFRQAPGFERGLVESGIHLFKLWFSVSRTNQLKRFEVRRTDPLRQWKFSPVDEASLEKWDDYTRARDAMLIHCDSPASPWTVVNSNEKKRARLESMRHVVHTLDYDHKDLEVARLPDPRVVQPAVEVMRLSSVPSSPAVR
jgi:polyphosphate kinase